MSKGDVLAILMPNCPEYLLALLGTTGRDISNLCPGFNLIKLLGAYLGAYLDA
jgi:hypothetical protein